MAATDQPVPDRRSPSAPPLPTGRGVELVLLAFAAVLVTGALVLVEANQEEELRPALFYVGRGLPGPVHRGPLRRAQARALRRPVDPALRGLLNGLGLVMIHRLDLAQIDQATALGRELPTELVYRQIAWTTVGLVLFVAVLGLVRDHRLLSRTPTRRASPGWSCWPCPACCRPRSPR